MRGQKYGFCFSWRKRMLAAAAAHYVGPHRPSAQRKPSASPAHANSHGLRQRRPARGPGRWCAKLRDLCPPPAPPSLPPPPPPRAPSCAHIAARTSAARTFALALSTADGLAGAYPLVALSRAQQASSHSARAFTRIHAKSPTAPLFLSGPTPPQAQIGVLVAKRDGAPSPCGHAPPRAAGPHSLFAQPPPPCRRRRRCSRFSALSAAAAALAEAEH